MGTPSQLSEGKMFDQFSGAAELRKLMDEAGVSIQGMAQRTCYNERSIGRYLSGERGLTREACETLAYGLAKGLPISFWLVYANRLLKAAGYAPITLRHISE